MYILCIYTYVYLNQEIELDPEVALDLLDVLDDNPEEDMDPEQVHCMHMYIYIYICI